MRRPTVFGQTTKYFAERQEARRKYILVYEGNQTEVQYFNGVIAHRNQLRVNPILELLPLLRSAADNTSSHPKIILQLLKEHFEEYKTAKVIIDKIVDYVIEVQWNGKCVESVATNLRKNLVWKFLSRMFHGSCHIRLNLALPLSRVVEAFARMDKYVFNA